MILLNVFGRKSRHEDTPGPGGLKREGLISLVRRAWRVYTPQA